MSTEPARTPPPATQPLAPSRRLAWPRAIFAPVLHEVFVAPIQQGRLRDAGWTPGLRAAASLSVVAYLGLLGLVIASGLIQRLAPIPSGQVGVHLAGLIGAQLGLTAVVWLALLAAAELRAAWRVPVLIVATAVIVGQAAPLWLLAPVLPQIVWPLAATLALSWVAIIGAVLHASGRTPTPRRVLVLAVLIGYPMLMPVATSFVLYWWLDSAASGHYAFLNLLAGMMVLLAVVLPIAYASGAAFSQITLTAATALPVATAEALGPRRARGWLALLCALLGVGLLVSALLDDNFAERWPIGALVAGWAGLAVWFAIKAAERCATEAPQPLAMAEQLVSGSLLVALGMALWYPIGLLPGTLPGNLIAYLLAAVVCVLLSGRAIRVGQVAAAAVFPAVGVACVAMAIGTTWPASGVTLAQREIATVAALALLGWLGWQRRRGPLGQGHWTLLAIGWLGCLLLPWREAIAEPIPALLGFSAVGVLFTGLLWRVLTEADWANGESAAAPRPARVLIFCAYALLTATGTVLVAYGDETHRMLNLDSYASIGSNVFGAALPVALVLALANLAHRRQPPIGNH